MGEHHQSIWKIHCQQGVVQQLASQHIQPPFSEGKEDGEHDTLGESGLAGKRGFGFVS